MCLSVFMLCVNSQVHRYMEPLPNRINSQLKVHLGTHTSRKHIDVSSEWKAMSKC